MFATHTTPQTPFRQTRYTPRPSPLSQHTTTPTWNMSPTPTPSQRPQTQTHHSTPLAQFIQTEPITRHTQPWNPSPIPMNFTAASASTTPTGTNPFQPRAQPTSPCTPTRAQAQAQKPKYEARYANIANPMKNTSALARAKTRKMFLNRVRGEREEGRFEARGEQMMLMEHLADRRRWEECMAREGEGVVVEGEEGEDDMLPDDADVLDEIIAQEEEAMQRAFMETQNGVHGRVELLRGDGPNVSFSDDEYEDIFMGLSDPQGQQFQSQSQSQDMDMS